MITRWGRELDAELPLPEYPRPQLVRDSYLCLNGHWEYAVGGSADFEGTGPAAYPLSIVVPFSPEAPLSGVGRQLRPDECAFYRRRLTVPADFASGRRLVLHFGAVDQSCRVLVDGVEVTRHQGGYLPFSVDVTGAADGREHELVVAVVDPSETGVGSRGKQRLDRGGIWYTAQSGLWQTVWLEAVPAQHVAALELVPTLDTLTITVRSPLPGDATVDVFDDGRLLASAVVPTGRPAVLELPGVRPWSPEDPHLLDLRIRLGEDQVTSYAALRTIAVGPDSEGTPRLLLNGEPYFQAGVLDQGYWPDGLLTPPSDEAMVHDIEAMKRLGFTMLRKHLKVELLRWYHHCDRLGMLVWQDFVNGGGHYRHALVTAPAFVSVRLPDRGGVLFGRWDRSGREQFERELRETVELLRSVPSVVLWVPFNEGWGQFDARRIAREVRRLDPSRPVDHASGWHDQGGGDLNSHHVYFRPFHVSRRDRGDRRVLALTEYGGFAHAVPGHRWGTKVFGYRVHRTPQALAAAFASLHRTLARAVPEGLSATVYTQLSDVEDELNGLLTYDREVSKLTPEQVRAAITPLAARSRPAAPGPR